MKPESTLLVVSILIAAPIVAGIVLMLLFSIVDGIARLCKPGRNARG